MKTSARIALLAATSLALAAVLSSCGDSAVPGARSCTAPEGTVPFVFESAGRELFGFVDVPDSPGPYPAILLLHDSGRTDVTRGLGDFAALRDAFRAAGVASVVWDKAGSGCSGGRYRGLADLYVRADDVLAALDALRAIEAVDSDRVGVWALGEGGWVAPMAAVRTDAIEFVILVGGPAGDPIDRLGYTVGRRLERAGYAPEESRDIVDRLVRALAAMRDQAPYRDYQAAVAPLAEHPLLPPLSEAGSDVYPTERRYDELRESAALHVTPEVFLPAVEAPVLAIWGDRDSEVDWRRAMRAYREAFARGANADVTIRVFEGADHAICTGPAAPDETSEADGSAPAAARCPLAEDYLETMTSWLAAYGFTRSSGPRQTRADASPRPIEPSAE
ncbi:MAG TPA: alpha/beta hydrolase [Gammaproteobacteria bacterium]